MDNKTSFEDKCNILADLWLNYRSEAEFDDFVTYNDLGLPLAFLFAEGIVKKASEQANQMVEETFDILLEALNLEDEGFDNMTDLLARSEE